MTTNSQGILAETRDKLNASLNIWREELAEADTRIVEAESARDKLLADIEEAETALAGIAALMPGEG